MCPVGMVPRAPSPVPYVGRPWPCHEKVVDSCWRHLLGMACVPTGRPVMMAWWGREQPADHNPQIPHPMIPASAFAVSTRATRPPPQPPPAYALPTANRLTLFMVTPAGWGYVGAALAVGAANLYGVVLTSGYILWAGLGDRVFGGGWREVFQVGWSHGGWMGGWVCIVANEGGGVGGWRVQV